MQCQQRKVGIFPIMVAAALLTGCAMSAPHSTQSIVAGALVDPELEPFLGCAALTGEWENQGHQIKEHRIYAAILSGVLGMAEQQPDVAFADRVRLEMQHDGSLVLTASEEKSALGSLSVPAKDIQCEAARVEFRQPERMQLAVDAQGALWIKRRMGLLAIPYSYRFLPVGHDAPDCLKQLPNCAPGQQRMPTPTGMAMVMTGVGADLAASIRKVDDRLDMMMVQDGAMTKMVETVYLLPGTHHFDVRVWTLGDYWSKRPQTDLTASATLEACHTYVPVGRHREGGESWAMLIDMGKGFDTGCVGFLGMPRTAIRFSDDERQLLVSELCYAPWGGSTGVDAPPREFPLPQPAVAP